MRFRSRGILTVLAVVLIIASLVVSVIGNVCTRVDAEFKEVYPTEVQETSAYGLQEIPAWRSLGIYKITNYCSCYECNGQWTGYLTRSGTNYVEGRTVGVDTNYIPLGSKIMIDGHIYTAEDTGSFRGKVIDVYVSDHSKFDRKYEEVYILEG